MSQGARSVNTYTKGSCGRCTLLTAQQSRTVNKVQQSRCWSVLDRAGKRAVHRKGAIFVDLELTVSEGAANTLWNIPVYCDQEECLREVEKSQASGRAVQRLRALKERLQILIEDARRCGVEIILDDVAQWAVRHAELIQNFLGKSDVVLSDGGTIKLTPHEALTRDQAPSNVVGFLERVLVRSKINDDKQPRFLVRWTLGHKDVDIITFMEDGSVRYNGLWKYSPEGRSARKVEKHKTTGAIHTQTT